MPANIEEILGGIDENKLLQAFKILGIPVEGPDVDSRGNEMEDFMVEQMNEPVYWNDRKTMPPPGQKHPLWEPMLHLDETAGKQEEPKNAGDGQQFPGFMG